MANIEDLQGVPGVFGGVKVDEPIAEEKSVVDQINVNNGVVDGVFGGAKFEPEQPVNDVSEVGANLPTTPGIWSKVKSVLYYDFNFKLTPYQQKIEDELNDFIFEKLSWSNFKNFLFGRNKK